MDRSRWTKQFKGVAILGIAGLALAVGLAYGISRRSSSKVASKQMMSSSEPPVSENSWSISQVFLRYQRAWDDAEKRMDEIQNADRENRRLELENANLRMKLEAVDFNCRAREAAKDTHDISLKLSQETWAMAGRSLETITYQIPQNLLPGQLYTLAVAYFRNSEFEKAAKIMTQLTGMEDSDAFKTPKNFLMTGVLWYRLDNYALADKYFDKVLQFSDAVENEPYQAQSRLWRALVADRMNHHSDSQKWLVQLLDHHPLSMEAQWVNAKEVRGARGLATESHE